MPIDLEVGEDGEDLSIVEGRMFGAAFDPGTGS